MKQSSGDKRPYLKPVTRIELSEKNIKQRVILLVVLLAVAGAAIFTGVRELLKVEPGWQQVEAISQKANCSRDFVLMYDFSDYGGSAATVNRELVRTYSQSAETAFVLFSPDVEDQTVNNLCAVNQHINETITVDPVLYNAFSMMEEKGNRSLYLAPAYAEYDRIFLCETEEEAALYDPAFQEELLPYLGELASFASDPDAIQLELLGENQVHLKVSQAYLTFAQEYGIETFLDFGWMKNAFVADYLAQTLMEKGYTCGYLTSFDGFTRNLDSRGNSYSLNIFHRQNQDVYMPATLTYTGPMSLVSLRDFPLSQQDRWHYVAYSSGWITTAFLDPVDARCKSATTSLTGYSAHKSCAEILLELVPVFLTEQFHPETLETLAQRSIHSLWFQDNVLYTTAPEAELELLEDSYSFQEK